MSNDHNNNHHDSTESKLNHTTSLKEDTSLGEASIDQIETQGEQQANTQHAAYNPQQPNSGHAQGQHEQQFNSHQPFNGQAYGQHTSYQQQPNQQHASYQQHPNQQHASYQQPPNQQHPYYQPNFNQQGAYYQQAQAQQQQGYYQQPMYQQPAFPVKTNDMAIASLIMGILALIIPFLGFILAIITLFLSPHALKQINQSQPKQNGRGLAITGLVLSIIVTVFYAFYLLIFILVLWAEGL